MPPFPPLAKTPIVNTSQGSSDIDSSLLTIIAFIIGIILTLTIVGLISLSYCLVKTKKKNKKLKIGNTTHTQYTTYFLAKTNDIIYLFCYNNNKA